MSCGGNAHPLVSKGDGKDLCSVVPGDDADQSNCGRNWLVMLFIIDSCATELTVAHCEEVDANNRKSLANRVISVLEFTLHDRRIDFSEDTPSNAGKKHSKYR
jgi:hypothetical protein